MKQSRGVFTLSLVCSRQMLNTNETLDSILLVEKVFRLPKAKVQSEKERKRKERFKLDVIK